MLIISYTAHTIDRRIYTFFQRLRLVLPSPPLSDFLCFSVFPKFGCRDCNLLCCTPAAEFNAYHEDGYHHVSSSALRILHFSTMLCAMHHQGHPLFFFGSIAVSFLVVPVSSLCVFRST